MTITDSRNPVDSIVAILQNNRQFEDLVVPEGDTETIPEDEIWYVSGEIEINGELIINGRVINGEIYRVGKPVVFRHDDTTPQGRENEGRDAAYVMDATSAQFDRFGVEPDTQDEQTADADVSILVKSLTEGNARVIAEDIRALLASFMSDNYTETAWHHIAPSQIIDNRAGRITRQTSHFDFIVETTLHRKDQSPNAIVR